MRHLIVQDLATKREPMLGFFIHNVVNHIPLNKCHNKLANYRIHLFLKGHLKGQVFTLGCVDIYLHRLLRLSYLAWVIFCSTVTHIRNSEPHLGIVLY